MTAPSNLHAQFTASVPENYDRYLGMVLFDPFARDLARRIPGESRRILETACGSGIVTRRLLQALPPGATLVATDLNAPMVDRARAAVGSDPRVTWRTADMCHLGLPDRSFDAVVCQFGLMFVPDKVSAMREALRVLVPGGLYLFNVWDSLATNRFGAIANEVIAGFFPEDPPGFYQVPFSLHDTSAVQELLAQAGFQDVRGTHLDLGTTARSADEFAKGLVEGNPVVAEIQARGGATVEDVRTRLAGRLRAEMGDQPVSTRLRAFVYESRAPR
jgi:ubiquinone/menaquinone biosynthesis C-methylase UbiE